MAYQFAPPPGGEPRRRRAPENQQAPPPAQPQQAALPPPAPQPVYNHQPPPAPVYQQQPPPPPPVAQPFTPPAQEPLMDWRHSREEYDNINIGDTGRVDYSDDEIARAEVQYQIFMRIVCGTFFGLFAALFFFWLIPPINNFMFIVVFVFPFLVVALPIYVFGEPLIKWLTESISDLFR